jgi:PhzF family phenazine biosynthesis protein
VVEYKPFVVNAFTKDGAGGNPAGVVWLENAEFPAEEEMQALAAELAYSETAFIRRVDKKESVLHEASDGDDVSLYADQFGESGGAPCEPGDVGDNGVSPGGGCPEGGGGEPLDRNRSESGDGDDDDVSPDGGCPEHGDGEPLDQNCSESGGGDDDDMSPDGNRFESEGGVRFETRYFTPVAEVDLCGHATIGAFTALLSFGVVSDGGNYTNCTQAGDLSIKIVDGCVFMEAGEPIELAVIKDRKQLRELYEVMGLDFSADVEALPKTAINFPAIVSTGLPDIMLPVQNNDTLLAIAPDFEKLADLSESYGVVGVHAFVSEPHPDGWRVRNFAPLYGIDEESATGTANAALAYRLYLCGEAVKEKTLRFVQGESMGLPSEILCSIEDDADQCRVWVGGEAVVG